MIIAENKFKNLGRKHVVGEDKLGRTVKYTKRSDLLIVLIDFSQNY